MGGPHAPDDLQLGYLTQVWLATSDEPGAKVSGSHWHHQQQLAARPPHLTHNFRTRSMAPSNS
jgi:hypothetical protein